MNANSVLTKDYGNVPPWRPKKTNPNEPNLEATRTAPRQTFPPRIQAQNDILSVVD
jgi:hypothetical protein